MSQRATEAQKQRKPLTQTASSGMRAEILFVRIPMHVLAVVMIAGVALNFINVIARYFFSAPIFWAEEVLVYAMIWAVFLALPAVTFSNDHLRMDLFYLKLQARLRMAVDVLCGLLYVVFGTFAAWNSYKVVALLAEHQQASVTAGLPMAIVHAALPIGFALMVLAVAVRALTASRGRKETAPQ